jgi:putative two-component system response regulator
LEPVPAALAGTLLVIDDEPSVRRLLVKLLEAQGYEVLAVADGLAGLELLQARTVDTVLLDVRLPGIDGIEICRRIRAHAPTQHTPVVFLTALNDREFRREGRAAGADDFLTKPFDEIELLARVRNTVRVKRYYDGLERDRERLQLESTGRLEQLEATIGRLQRLQAELVRAERDTITRLTRAAEFRDDETAAHLQRMSHYCHLLGGIVGLDDYRNEMLRVASPMHDVGKIGIPDHILLKPGRLDADEFQIMKQHAEIGYRILSDSDSELVAMAAMIAHTHHEKFDGTGYPHGLTGVEIPIEGRITAIADVFDALTSARPYKVAWPVDDAVAFMRHAKGRHFDPDLTELFLGALPDVLAIRAQFRDIHPAASGG